MAVTWTTDDLLRQVRRTTYSPAASTPFTDAELLDFADEQKDAVLVPRLIACREDYLRETESTAIAAGTAEYALPTRAVGGRVLAIAWVDSAGNYWPLEPLAAQDRGLAFNVTPGAPAANMRFILGPDSITLVPTPSASVGTLVIDHYRRPNALVPVSECARVTGFSNPNITVNAIPASWSSSGTCDIVRALPGFDWVQIDRAYTGASGVNINVGGTNQGTVVGDYICQRFTSCVVQLPYEWRHALVQATAVKVLEAVGDRAGMQITEVKLQQVLEAAVDLVSPRVDGTPRKIVNRNGPISRTRFGWR
jgi:hypothetical protein